MKGKKWRDVRNALVMVIVMVAMMSSATFAWFTLTSSPTVAGLEMVAASSGGLVVSDKSNSGFTNAITLPVDANKLNANGTENPLKLVPVSPQIFNSSYGFSEAKYSGGKVTGLQSKVYTDAELEGKVAKYTYYIKAEEGTVGVGIITGDPDQSNPLTVTNNTANAAGTLVRAKESSSDTATAAAANAIRIGLVVTDVSVTPNIADMIIYEPNSDTHHGLASPTQAESTYSYDETNFAADIISSGGDGAITTGGLTTNVGETTSKKLFEVGTDPKKVTMYVWLEGTDTDCVDQIKADEMEAQIQFTIVEEITTTP